MQVLEIPEIRKRVQAVSLETYQTLCKLDPKYYENTELFRGVVIKKMTKSPEHDYFSQIFAQNLSLILPKEYFLGIEKGIQIFDSELEPDISILLGSPKDYKHKKPTTARLVVEISVTSLEYDREKALDYAKANIEEYWIVDVENELVEVYLHPTSEGYNTKQIYKKAERLPAFDTWIELQKVFE
ncbi:MAG: Uma2 family endonuclease [Leptospiraceae bacterium]|nr:Uma2 family endonuclease [Leptospiraceae bacterium]